MGKIYLLFLCFSTLFIFTSCKDSPIKDSSSSTLSVKGSSIYDDEFLLFENVHDVEKIRLGPDGRTLHFKLTEEKLSYFQTRCADLGTKVKVDPNPFSLRYPPPNPPPTIPPWDYERIGYHGTIHDCDGSGYLNRSDYFAYLEESSSGEWTLYVEDESLDKIYRIPIDSSIFHKDGKKILKSPFLTKEGITYYYPIRNAVLSEGIVLSFKDLNLAIDILDQRFIGYEIIPLLHPRMSSGFRFDFRTNLPFVVVSLHYEGSVYVSLIDISNGQLKLYDVIPLNLLAESNPIEWQTDRLLLHSYKSVYADDEISQEYRVALSDANFDAKEAGIIAQKAQKELMSTGKYVGASCDQIGMLPGGCFGYLENDVYEIVPGGELKKIEAPSTN